MNASKSQSGPKPASSRSEDRNYLSPEVNIYETKDEFIIEAEMPGVTKEGLEVLLEGNLLTFIGRRSEEGTKAHLLYRESRPADFRRTFELDAGIDTESISAKIDQGILTLRLPKSERVKPRKIEVSD